MSWLKSNYFTSDLIAINFFGLMLVSFLINQSVSAQITRKQLTETEIGFEQELISKEGMADARQQEISAEFLRDLM